MKSKFYKSRGAAGLLAALAAVGVQFVNGTTAEAFALDKLAVDHLENPQAIDNLQPRFSWQMLADKGERNVEQAFYQLIVRDMQGEILWDSGKVADGHAVDIAYQGRNLAAGQDYLWEVKVWDKNGQLREKSARFAVGLNPDRKGEGEWSGAKWIGSSEKTLPLESQSLTVFRLACDMELGQTAEKASLVFGANDQRLLDKNFNMAGTAAEKDKSYFRAEFDCSALKSGGEAKINFYRHGYVKGDNDTSPIGCIVIPAGIVHRDNYQQKHNIEISSMYGILAASVDGQELPVKELDPWSKGINGNPFGMSGGANAFPALADIGYAVPDGQKAKLSHLTVKNFRQPFAPLYEDGQALELTGQMRLVNPSHGAMPMLRTEFKTKAKKIKQARLYATARGIYEIFINGRQVSDDYFAPGFTQYNKTQLYQAYDVTNLLQAGRPNVIGAQLAEGWWSGAITFQGANWNYFGDRQSLRAKLLLVYEDGTQESITTQPDNWQYYADGPVKLGSLFQGQVQDGIKAVALRGWDKPGYDAARSGWKPAAEISLAGTTATGKWHEFLTDRDYEQQFTDIDFVAQSGSEVKAARQHELIAKSVQEVRPGVFVYDMGQNFAGVPEIDLIGQKGRKVTLRYAEVTYPDGENKDMLMVENLRAAMVRDTFILRGGRETISPHFTFHGYRYLEITGLDEALPLKAVRGKVLTSVPQDTAAYHTSNDAVNRLFQNIQWSTRANFLAIPTDCPQRNERMGWSGDLNVFGNTAVYLADSDSFLRQHMLALRDTQAADGRFTDTAPLGHGAGGFIWGSVGVQIPWQLYLQYGDTAVLAEHYDAMKAYVDYMLACEQPDGLYKEAKGLPGLGDWLGPENSRNEPQYLWQAYGVSNLEILWRTAEKLGKTSDAAKYHVLYERRKAYFNDKFLTADGKALNSTGGSMDTQTAYAVPLALDVVSKDKKGKVAGNLLQTIIRPNVDDWQKTRPAYSLMTGFIGTAAISHALSETGSAVAAYRLLQNDQYPSWLYPVKNGATTIWERLDSYTKERGFGGNNSMNSFNHYSFGAVGAWLLDSSLGIRRDEQNPGFKHFFLCPEVDESGQMTEASGHYDSVYGRIESSWQKTAAGYKYSFVVPANTTATVKLPKPAQQLLCNGREMSWQENIEVGSGKYEFEVR